MTIKDAPISTLKYIGLLFFVVAVVFCSCNQNSNKDFKSPPNYDLSRPYIIKLPSELKEISGIAYYKRDNSLFAESDEKGSIYKIYINKPTDIRKWKFSHKRDYEDIVYHDSTLYVLNSNGDIISLNFVQDSLVSHEYSFPDNTKNEFESLYYDEDLKKLVLVCKDCENDAKTTASTYTFDMEQCMYNSAFAIDVKETAYLNNPNSIRFKPSAAAINPVTGELYILSSINKVLVIASRKGKVKNAYQLNPVIFNQPEGITFMPDGGMFISNEARTAKSATILYFQFQKNK